MKPVVQMGGQIFGDLTVLFRAPVPTCKGHVYWTCRCSCGVEFDALGVNIRQGRTRSCGHTHTTHGRADHPLYDVWKQMLRRCSDPTVEHYHRYGGRGISVCPRWSDFEAYLADVGERPFEGAELDREDNNGNYEPSNCRWVTHQENCANRGYDA